MKLQESIRRILREERNNYEMFIIRRFDIIDKILKEELEDQVPCYWKEKYKDNDPEYGLELYWSVVVRAVAERTLEIFPEYYREDVEEEYEIYGELLYNIKRMFNKEIKEYYNNADCSTYGESNDFLLREELNNYDIVYRGQPEDEYDISPRNSIWVTYDYDFANLYGRVKEYKLPKNLNILDTDYYTEWESLVDEFDEYGDHEEYKYEPTDEFILFLESKGYDGFINGDNILIFNKNKLFK